MQLKKYYIIKSIEIQRGEGGKVFYIVAHDIDLRVYVRGSIKCDSDRVRIGYYIYRDKINIFTAKSIVIF